MQEDSLVRVKLIEAAKAEFLRRGYQKASLRAISQAAGVTTGAIYFFFGSKDSLFHAVVDKTADALRACLIEGAQKEYSGETSGEDNDRAFIECLHQHPEEAIILLEKSADSPLAGFRQELTKLLEDGFVRFFFRAGGAEADLPLIKLLVEQRVHVILALIAQRLDLETTMRYAVLIGAYGDAGFAGMMNQYHKMQKGSAG
jgi:AcrR family transcriptional regulator